MRSHFFQVALIASMILLGVVSTPRLALAESDAHRALCSSLASSVQSDLDVFTNPPSLAIDGKPSAADVETARRQFNQDERWFARDCAGNDPNRPFVEAVMAAFKAWVLHYQNDSGAAEQVELAAQKLTACASHYFATDKGAKCSLLQRRVIKWSSEWSDGDDQ